MGSFAYRSWVEISLEQITRNFEAVRELFDQELRLLRANEADDSALWDDWEAVHAELHDPGIRLEATDTSYTADEILP